MARWWFSKLLDYGTNKQAWDENSDKDNATPWTQDVSNIWRGVTHYGFNRDAWAEDKAANDSLGALGRELGAIGTIGAAVVLPEVVGGSAGYGAGAAKIGSAAWKYGGADAAKAAGGAYAMNALAPDEPTAPVGNASLSPVDTFNYAKLAQQMYQNQGSQMRYGGTFGGKGGGGQSSKKSMNYSGFRGW